MNVRARRAVPLERYRTEAFGPSGHTDLLRCGRVVAANVGKDSPVVLVRIMYIHPRL